jgi:hypothetical protein
MEKDGLIELKISVKDYSKFFLVQNPFPAVGVPEEYPRITIDREAIKRRFQNVISEVVTTGKTIITVMVGEYGSGKSHLLKLFRNSVNAQLLTNETGALAIYVKSPGEEFSDFFYSMIDGIGKELLIGQSRRFLTEETYSNPEYGNFIYDSKVHDQYNKRKAALDDILSKSQTVDMFGKIRKERFGDIKNPDVVYAFLNMARVEMATKAWRWFLGQHLEKDETGLGGLNVEQQITAGNAYQTFLDFMNVLRVIGIKYLVILIDELEKITLLSSVKRAKYQDQLRQMIDDNPKGMCLYFAVAPRQWEALTKEPTALVRRLSANWYILDEFRASETRELIEAYLFTSRTPDYSADKIKNISPKCEPSLYPFTDDAVNVISKKSKGVVSNILVLARRSLEILADKSDGFQVVTAELVAKEIKPGLI